MINLAAEVIAGYVLSLQPLLSFKMNSDGGADGGAANEATGRVKVTVFDLIAAVGLEVPPTLLAHADEVIE